ncbi:myo-inositol-1(or 4)-monophosphatase [Cognatiyoonia koreensis]|uniref:Inositol-1-monophosphatase n=1 Tax=Cognatiyoonia koreensis TaxID=364200 RepID=A0A1I0MJM2_9RHOB|nr:inositol monophosphatase [Cognatiyoonia koreensis]SEV88254.1 myo-inositol-1(or 4)-monophosphatase [Cognatiyoonia koreensis]
MALNDRASAAIKIAQSGGALAKDYFARIGSIEIVDKGVQDFVTEADQNVELHIRSLIEEAFPDDGIVGEEHAVKTGTTGYRWVIDPIDGTSNFINAMPAWCVVLAVVKDDMTEFGVIHDPMHDETYQAVRKGGATLNGETLKMATDAAFDRGSVSTGYCNRSDKSATLRIIEELIKRDGVFHRNGSGALSLAYVAAGRLIGYIEEHMNAWDCLAGQLIIAEAGGRIETQSADSMIANGGRVIAGNAGIFDDLVAIANASYGT